MGGCLSLLLRHIQTFLVLARLSLARSAIQPDMVLTVYGLQLRQRCLACSQTLSEERKIHSIHTHSTIPILSHMHPSNPSHLHTLTLQLWTTLVSCRRAQILWSLPGCSGCDPPQLQLCFSIMESYTRPVPPSCAYMLGEGSYGRVWVDVPVWRYITLMW